MLVDIARDAIASTTPANTEALARQMAEQMSRRLLQRVINGTGVLLHTNLGRAPVEHHQPAGYNNLEFDLDTGQRGSRSDHAGALLAKACGAEAAIVVNNNAAAVLLSLAALARGRQVAVSRGEAVEIGGGFRVPEIMATSGATLVDVGTTNRTRLADYRTAVEAAGADVAVLLKVHPSNYTMTGFVEEAGVDELATYVTEIDADGSTPRPLVIVDLGSGLLDATTPWLPGGPPLWLANEPAARQTLEAGADLVMFSGDKLLGGPQAGIIAGRRDLVEACGRHPLARALRPGGMVLQALHDLALAYLRRDACSTVAFWRLSVCPVADLRNRTNALGVGTPTECASVPGAGTLPGVEIPSYGVSIAGDHTEALRRWTPPIIARCENDATIIDMRTVDPSDDHIIAAALSALTSPG